MEERCAVRAAWACAVRAGSGGDVGAAAAAAAVEVVVLVVVEEEEGAGGFEVVGAVVEDDGVEDAGSGMELEVVVGGGEVEAMALIGVAKKARISLIYTLQADLQTHVVSLAAGVLLRPAARAKTQAAFPKR